MGLIYLAYTALLLAKATRHMDAWIAVPAVCYAVLLVLLVLAWRDCVRSLVL
ncbi:hypothetical protein ACIRD9_11990 [Streptomyces violaceus]|uniref:hypothetical protein n=1 Tax=Streptomyces violaceus TaxID=1936 RepID=UPI0037F7DAE7